MTVPAASRVLDVIEAFSRRRRPMTVATLAKMLELPASSCHGLIKTLEDRGYLMNLKDQGGYYFTKRLEQHAVRIAGYDPLPDWVIPALEAMRDEAGETTLLAKLSGKSAVYLEVLESPQSVRYIAQVGDLRPLYASAAGKALLGAVDLEERERLLEGMPLMQRNPNTIVTREALDADIRRSLERGWSMTKGEFLSDVTAAATSVTLNGEPYAAVIAGPSARMETRIDAHVALLKVFAERAVRVDDPVDVLRPKASNDRS
jgi:IclR family acetate operon transcriptional repressor